MAREEQKRAVQAMAENCLMMRSRLLSRVVTGIYDEELGEFGIKASQLNLLVAIAQVGPVRRSDLARALHIDISTLTRNLRVMESNEWIEETHFGADGRGAPLRATAKGLAMVSRVKTAWDRAQRRARDLLTPDAATQMLVTSNRLMAGR